MTEDGDFVQLTVTQLAKDLGVNRTTLYDWPRIIPNFNQRVAARQKEIYAAGGSRANNVWKALWLRASAGEKPQAEMVLSHFAGYTPPAQKHEVQVSGLADLANLARRKGIVEGEVIELEPQPAQLPAEAA